MSLNPKKGCKAHSQIGQHGSPCIASPAAAASQSHPQDSLARGSCDLRGPQSAPGDRSAGADQPSPLKQYVERQRARERC
jgi:hypothetical protein